MRKTKLFLLVAAALVAVIAATSARAATGDVTLCKTATAPCPIASQYAAKTPFSASLAASTKVVLTTNFDTISCTGSTATAQNNAEAGTPLPGQINSLTVTGCADPNGANCTVTISDTPYPESVSYTSAGNGTVKVNTLDADLQCGGLIDCTLTAPSGGISGTLTGGNPATVKFTNAPLGFQSGGILCPATTTLSATYNTTGANRAVWVEQSS